MLSLYKDNKKIEFIIYTNSSIKVINSILKYELTFMKHKVNIVSISILIDIYYNQYVKEAIMLYKKRILLQIDINNNNLNPINYDSNDNIQFEEKTYKLRDNYNSWSYIYPSYLLHLLHNGIFLARASLNLRLVALSQHGGLYLDFDIMTIMNIKTIQLNNILKSKINYEKELYKFHKNITNTNNTTTTTTTNNNNNNNNNDPKQLLSLVKFSKRIQSLLNISLDLKSKENKKIGVLIDDYLSMIRNNLSQRIKNCLNEYIICNNNNDDDDIYEYNDGIYAISSKYIKNNDSARFSQNIMYVNDVSSRNNVRNSFINAIYFNMIISSIEPGYYMYLKTNSIHFICPNNDDNLKQQLTDILLPSDIFFSRKSRPYLINNNSNMTKVNYRTGRPLHPLGQIATRGCWNFLKKKQFKTSNYDFVKDDKFSAVFEKTQLFPESSILSEEECSYKKSSSHWTKLKNEISII
jgi:hypothetical protein